MERYNLISGVLDIDPNRETQRRIGRGRYSALQDYRLILLAECDRTTAVEQMLTAGDCDTTGSVWLDIPAVAPA